MFRASRFWRCSASASRLLAEAEAALSAARVGDALSLLDAAKRADPFAPRVDLRRAMCFAHLGDPFSARQCVLEELRHPGSNSATQAEARLLAASLRKRLLAASFLVLDPQVAAAEPVFAMAYDALLDHSMLDAERLFALYAAARDAVTMFYDDAATAAPAAQRRRPVLIECGTAGGGSVTLMGIAAMEVYLSRRRAAASSSSSSELVLLPPRVVAADTFRGMPPPTDKDALVAATAAAATSAAATHWADGTCSGSEERVRALGRNFGVDIETVPGLFADTLPTLLLPSNALEEELVMLHVDCDWYESTRDALRLLWPRLAPGGRGKFQVDDFLYWKGCQRAVEEHFSALAKPPKCSTASVALCGTTT